MIHKAPMATRIGSLRSRTTDEGTVIDMPVKVGQEVIYSKYAGTEYTEDGVDYLIVRESDILAIVG